MDQDDQMDAQQVRMFCLEKACQSALANGNSHHSDIIRAAEAYEKYIKTGEE